MKCFRPIVLMVFSLGICDMVTAQNKVGINTLSPISDLDVRGMDDVLDGGEFQLATPNMTSFIRMFGGRIGDPNPFLAFSDLDTFRFVTTSSDWSTFTRRLTITPDGKLGIGTQKPLSLVDIRALGDGAELLRFTTDRPWVIKQTGTGINTALTFQSTTNDKALQILSESGTNMAARFFTSNAYSKVSLVPDAGEVGIGILEAAGKLHVRGNSTTTDPQLRITETTTTDFARIKMENENEPGIFWDIAALADSSASLSKINFYYANPGFTGDKMTITGEGNVGIGTTSPGNRLRVNGSSTSSQHVFSASTNYSGNVHIRAVEGFSTPAEGYGIAGFFVGGYKAIDAEANGGAAAGTVTGVEATATGTSGTRIGLFGAAVGGATNWAGYFGAGHVRMENNLYVDDNVGIGTSSPSEKLHVVGDMRISGLAGSGDRNVIVDSNGKLKFNALGSGGGNGWVENGTQVSTTLEVYVDSPNSPTSSVTIDGRESNGNNFSALSIYNNTEFPGGTYNRMLLDADDIDAFRGAGSSPIHEDLHLQRLSSGNLILTNGGGNVGIGTWTPASRLTVNGGENNGTAGSLEVANGSQKMLFDGNEIDVVVGTLLINANSGNQVAIGTATPALGYKLSVDGKVIAEEVRVQLSGDWPDYVFQEDYPLPSLKELQYIISQQGHLPGIPSAAEIASDGLHLGDMQRKLLEKIEELTLYVIQLDAENQKLKERIENLEHPSKTKAK